MKDPHSLLHGDQSAKGWILILGVLVFILPSPRVVTFSRSGVANERSTAPGCEIDVTRIQERSAAFLMALERRSISFANVRAVLERLLKFDWVAVVCEIWHYVLGNLMGHAVDRIDATASNVARYTGM